MKIGDRVRIVGDHPHKGETGTVTPLEPPSMSRIIPGLKNMMRIDLDDNSDGCYAERINLRLIPRDEDPHR